MKFLLIRKDFTEEVLVGLKLAFEKIRWGQAVGKNEGITAQQKTSYKWNGTGIVCSVFKKYMQRIEFLKNLTW